MLKEAIQEQIYKMRSMQPPREYLGASSLGNPCERAIWYGYKQFARVESPKTLITFEIGRSLEGMLVDMLSNTQLTVMFPTPANNFLSFAHEKVPQLSGHLDGLILHKGEHYVLEIKTANSSSFTKVCKVGVRAWRSQYYDQIQTYMGLSCYTKGIFLVINKDSSDLYEEVIEFDQIHYELLVAKATRIIQSSVEPERLNESPMYFGCRMCAYREVCHS